MSPETSNERLAPFPIEHRIRIRTRFMDIEWCVAECARIRPSRWWLVACSAALVASLFWLPVIVLAIYGLARFGAALAVWGELLAVRKYLGDQVGRDLAEWDLGNAVTRVLPEA